MWRHHRERPFAAWIQKSLITGRVKLKQRGSVVKTLRPLRPALRGIAAFHRKDRRCRTGWATLFDGVDALGRTRPKLLQLWKKIGRRQFSVKCDHRLRDGSRNNLSNHYRLIRAEPPPAMCTSSSSVIGLVSPRVLMRS